MAGYRKSGGSNISLSTFKRRSGGAWTVITTAKRRIAGAWVDLLSLLAMTSNQNLTATSLSPTDATLTYTINTSGLVEKIVNGITSTVETWLIAGTSADFQARATIISGTFSSGTAGTWQTTNTSPTWSRNRTNNAAGVDTVVFTLEIRRVSDSVVIDSSTITLNAEVTL